MMMMIIHSDEDNDDDGEDDPELLIFGSADPTRQLNPVYIQVILAGTLTGVQDDIRGKGSTVFSTAKCPELELS